MGGTFDHATGGRLQIPRSRGAASGLLVMILGLWGALVPFIGPYFDFAFSPDRPWAWAAGRGWLQVLPGVVAILGGLMMLVSRNRATAMVGTWIAVLAGAWFVVGRAFAGPLGLGEVGTSVAATEVKRVWLELSYFYGLGALIVFLSALALGRLSVRTARDIAFADTHAGASTVEEPTDESHESPDNSGELPLEERATASGTEHSQPAHHWWGSLFPRRGRRSEPKVSA